MKFIVSFVLVLMSLPGIAQTISVSSFKMDEMDLTANLQGSIVLDQNGEKCALIKIFTTDSGFTFDVGSLGVASTIQKEGEIWVYVPHGIKKMRMNHAKLGILEYLFPCSIQSARTYKLELKYNGLNILEFDAKILEMDLSLDTLYQRGKSYYENKNYSESIKYLKIAAHQQQMDAIGLLGVCYLLGRGGKKDLECAFELLSLSAQHDNKVAIHHLAHMYYTGEYVEKNYVKAFEYFHKSASLGYSDAMVMEGTCYDLGRGVSVDKQKALQCFLDAAEKENAYAYLKLGVLYGEDTTFHSETKAFLYMEKAYKKGIIQAYSLLGGMYFLGKGVVKDKEKAFKIWEEGIAKDDLPSKLQYKIQKTIKDEINR